MITIIDYIEWYSDISYIGYIAKCWQFLVSVVVSVIVIIIMKSNDVITIMDIAI